MKTWSRAVSGERAEGALNALHLFPNPPCWALRTLLLRPQAPGGGLAGRQHARRAGRAGGRGGPRATEAEQRRSHWEVARPLGRGRPVSGGAVGLGAPWRSQPCSNHGFFSRLARALPSFPPFPPVNKYLPGQRTPRAASRLINFLEHQNRPSVSPLRSGYGARSLLFKKGNVALPKI